MKKVRIAMLLYVAVGLIPLAVLSRVGSKHAQREYVEQVNQAAQSSLNQTLELNFRANATLNELFATEFSREYTEYQHWRAPLNIQAQGPSVVRSNLAGPPRNRLIKFYFQVRSDGQTLAYNSPHQAEDQSEQLESYQRAEPLSEEFKKVVRDSREAVLTELPYVVSARFDDTGMDDRKPVAEDLLVSSFLSLKSGKQPSSVQVVSNEVLIVNSNSQDVANRARSEQIHKKANKAGREEDPWAGLKRPPGVDDPYGDSIVQVYPFCFYQRVDDRRRMIFWRTVRTPAEHIMQGFEIDLDYVKSTWLIEQFGTRAMPGSIFLGNWARMRSNQPVNWFQQYNTPTTPFGFATLLGHAYVMGSATAGFRERFERTRNTYLVVGIGYALIIAVVGLFLYRTVSRSEALAQQQGEFVAAVSHELRTPLTAMRLFTELLIGQAKTAKNEKVEQHASRILAEEERLTRLVEMILLAAKIERGSFKVEIAEAPLGETLGAAIEAALRAHAGREVINEARDLPIVKQDRAAAQQVFFNLIDNALKYSRDAGKPVSISSETKDGKLILRIIDQGAGISDSDKPRLFQRFARGTKANEQGAGTGLGLWLTREYARQMGWGVSLESKPGAGTTASVEIPL
ncbi:MAG: HAMP domain-containing histidine kinase [Planctomycetes bacterium]|nr:HAMP domain-containing histidine kinase [Planctomycetota bacterium]